MDKELEQMIKNAKLRYAIMMGFLGLAVGFVFISTIKWFSFIKLGALTIVILLVIYINKKMKKSMDDLWSRR